MTKLVVTTNVGIADAAAIILETPDEDSDIGLPSPLPACSQNGAVGNSIRLERLRMDDSAVALPAEQQIQMREPHISTLYEKQDVMAKHFGVTQEQALRTQALLRLGVTDEDVRVAEQLMAQRSARENIQSKAEWLLGYTHAQMSFHKALEVLGVSEAVVEEERSRRLGELGVSSWGKTAASNGISGQDAEDMCGGFFFGKRRRSGSQDAVSLGTTLPGDVVFPTTNRRVMQLEEVCHSQQNRIQQLESQLAALSAQSAPGTGE